MPTTTLTTYGPGGYDPDAADGNVVSEETVEVSEDPQQAARQRFRDALADGRAKATTHERVEALYAALLGEGTDAEPDVRPR